MKLEIKLPYDPAISLMDHSPNCTRTLIQRDIGIPLFKAELLTIANIWKQILTYLNVNTSMFLNYYVMRKSRQINTVPESLFQNAFCYIIQWRGLYTLHPPPSQQ